MLTVSNARQIILSTPGEEQHQHHGHPDFRVNNKIFATLWPIERRAVVKIAPADQKVLLKSSPKVFSTNAWSKHGWTNVHLQHINSTLFRQLVQDSWRAVAPKELVAEYVAD
jgi:hypothetical protein